MMGASAVVLSLGCVTILSAGPAVAAARAKAPTGTVKCTGVGATIAFNPALSPKSTTTKEKKITVSGVTLTGCTVGSTAVTASSVALKVKLGSGSTASCSSFATGTTGDQISMTVKWSSGPPSKVTFPTGAVTVNSSDNGFNAAGGKVTGSYATSSGAQFDVQLSSTSASAITACVTGSGTGVSSIQVNQGSSSL